VDDAPAERLDLRQRSRQIVDFEATRALGDVRRENSINANGDPAMPDTVPRRRR